MAARVPWRKVLGSLTILSATVAVVMLPEWSTAIAAVAVQLIVYGASIRTTRQSHDVTALVPGMDPAARLRHDIITPATAIHGFAALLAATDGAPLSPKQILYIQNIQSAANNLLGVIERNRLEDSSKEHDGT